MDTMSKVNPIPKSGNKDMLFKILIIAALVILFGLILYILFGPLPSQSNFVKKGSSSQETLNDLYVVGTSTLKGNVTANQNLTIGGNEIINGNLTVHDTNFVTGTSNVKQGSVVPSTGTLELRGNTYVKITDINGTDTTAEFVVGSKETNFNGVVNINNPDGVSGLILKNQTTPENYYKIYDNSSNNLIIDSYIGTSFKKILNAEEDASEVTFLDETIATPYVYVNGSGGKGRVYDEVYNLPPTASLTPTLTTLTVTGATTLNGTTTSNNTMTLNGATTMNDPVTINDNLTFPLDGNNIVFTPKSTSENAVRFAGQRTINSNVYMHQILGQSSTNVAIGGSTYIHAPTKVNITNSIGNGGSSLFDVRPNFTSGTKTDEFRNTFIEPFVNIANGYLKITLPPEGTMLANAPGGFPAAGQIVNVFAYTSSDTNPKTVGSFPPSLFATNKLGSWVNSDPTGQGSYVQSRMSSYTSVPNAGWTCPKKGLWAIEFNSNSTTFTNEFVIYNTTTNQSYGSNYVSTIAVIDFGQVIAITAVGASGTIAAGANATLKFRLIMELN